MITCKIILRLESPRRTMQTFRAQSAEMPRGNGLEMWGLLQKEKGIRKEMADRRKRNGR